MSDRFTEQANELASGWYIGAIAAALRTTDEQAHRRGQIEALENIMLMARNGTQASGIGKWVEDRLAELKAGK